MRAFYTPPRGLHPQSWRGTVLDANVWDVKRHLDPIPLKLPAAMTRCGVKSGVDWRKSGALQPGGRFAPGVKRRLQIHGRNREMIVKLDVVLPAPHHLDR